MTKDSSIYIPSIDNSIDFKIGDDYSEYEYHLPIPGSSTRLVVTAFDEGSILVERNNRRASVSSVNKENVVIRYEL